MHPDDLCPRPPSPPKLSTHPHAPPIYLASVYACESTDQAEAVLAGKESGYVYQRDGNPNTDMLAEKCRELHNAERAAIAATGMGALSVVLLSQLQSGDHVVLSKFLYGRTTQLLTAESARLGITSTIADVTNPAAVEAAFRKETKLLVVETIANPLLQVADITALAEIAHRRGAKLLVDNTFASPAICRPLELGADFVWESLTKIMNGHSDVILGLVCGYERDWQRMPTVLSAWGLAAAPFDSWLALRGLATLALRSERASANAHAAAEFLSQHSQVEAVYYPGLASHSQHALARSQFGDRFGAMLSFRLRGGRAAADAFIARAKEIPFCPSLGEVSTTLSHPESTSHRGLTPEARAELGISGGTIRLSVGCESKEWVMEALTTGLGEPTA
jgi:cystathionine beta-lyase/cystathionine gamma-synthase